VSLADFKGRKLVLYFYPKADTPRPARPFWGSRPVAAQQRNRRAARASKSLSFALLPRKFSEN
jgi:peroxiredoxin